MAAMATPFALVAVLKISAGIIQAIEAQSAQRSRKYYAQLTQRTHASESKVEQPSHDDESPMCTSAICRRGKLREQDCANKICRRHYEIPVNDNHTTTDLVDKGHYEELADEPNNGVDGLISERVDIFDADLFL